MAYRSRITKSGKVNLCFRRWLCFEQNLAAGLAQKVVRLREVTRWDIRNHVLVAGNRSGRLLIRQLRPCSGKPSVASRPLSLKILLWSQRLAEIGLGGCFATMDGDAIVNIDAVNSLGEDKGYIARRTATGDIIWFVANERSCLIVGVEYVYVLQWSLNWTYSCKIVTLDVQNGQILYTATLPYLQHAAEGSLGRFKMVLNRDESFISITNRNQVLGIYDTAARRLVGIEEPSPLEYAARAGTWVSLDPMGSGFHELYWHDHVNVALYQYTYDVSTLKFNRTLLRNFSGDSLAPQGGLHVHRGLIFEVAINPTTITYDRFSVRPLHYQNCNEPSRIPRMYQRYLTVPDTETGHRMPIEFPGRIPCQDYQ